ncbi:MAG: HAMP domain-containing protein [Proteobacteria bacterium]|nr:HAMP domain-containing protein [Pseudomonadota bacterium]
MEAVAAFAATELPPSSASPALIRAALARAHARLRADLALYDAAGALLAQAGHPPPLLPGRPAAGFVPGAGGPAFVLHLDDGRWLATRLPRAPRRPGAWLVMMLGAVAIAVAAGAFPVARRLTRRLERLKAGVERLGRGDLSARVEVEGRDEVAALAESFNAAAARIEELMRTHKMLLANCSHELRTPLARIGMALSLAPSRIGPAERAHLKADVAELDHLIDEILLASRLDAVGAPQRSEEIDLLALAAEEGARFDAPVHGRPVYVRGEAALLRRMIRNLVENARRHGGDAVPDIEVGVSGDAGAFIEVRDRGPGVAADVRERVFEPFFRLPGAPETGRGSGLGLALVRQIARAHGGEAECLASESGGRFRVMLAAIAPSY